jgi:hypothetical protein
MSRITGTSTDVAAPLASGDAEFIARLRRVDARRLLADTPSTEETLDLVASARIPEAVVQLESKAAQGDRDANVVLAQLSRLCAGDDAATQPGVPSDAARGPLEALPAVLRQRIELSRAVAQRERDEFDRACARVRFDAAAIDARLADAAAAGHEASLWEIGWRSDDPQLRHKHWLSAAMLGYVPAQVGLAETLMSESLQGDRRNRGRMNFWLEAAAKQSPRALLLLGECRLEGCNALPPDAESAVALLRDAAMRGQVGALAALAAIPRGDPAAPTDAELFSLHAFHSQLNELGCFGASPYGSLAVESGRAIKELGSRMSPHGLEEARTLAAQLWREHAAQARHIQGCD